MGQQQSDVREKQRTRLKEPKHYRVIIFNDDFTTMEFVVEMLRTVFFKTQIESEALMLKVHRSGQATVGIYTFDVAVSKVDKATKMARAAGFPLRLTLMEE